MANMSCGVCSQQYTETGDRVPRLLPCGSSVCESCLFELLDLKLDLTCPECESSHSAPNGVWTFPENQNIVEKTKDHPKTQAMEGGVTMTKEIVIESESKPETDNAREMCQEHKKEIVLFCTEFQCKKPLCLECLTKSHKKHNVVEIEEERERAKKERLEQRELLLKRVKEELEELKKTKEVVSEVGQKAKKASVDATRKIRLRRELIVKEIHKGFDKMTTQIREQIEESEKEVNQSVEDVENRMKLLQEMEKSVAASPEKDVAAEHKELTELKGQTLLTVKAIKFTSYEGGAFMSEEDTENLYGSLQVGEEKLVTEESMNAGAKVCSTPTFNFKFGDEKSENGRFTFKASGLCFGASPSALTATSEQLPQMDKKDKIPDEGQLERQERFKTLCDEIQPFSGLNAVWCLPETKLCVTGKNRAFFRKQGLCHSAETDQPCVVVHNTDTCTMVFLKPIRLVRCSRT